MNITGTIARFFLSNRPLTMLLLIGTVLAGIITYQLTPKQYNPEVIMPAFRITVAYPGATAEEVEVYLTRELEEKIADIEGVDHISSRSIDGGMAEVTVQFTVGSNLEEAKTKIQSQLSGNDNLRRGTMQEPLIQSIDPDNVPIITIGFQSDLLSQNQMRTKAVSLMNQLRQVPGVANLEVHGGQQQAMRVLLDPGRMKLRSVDVGDIIRALETNNIRVPAGAIENGTYTRMIEVNGIITDAKQAESIDVAPDVTLADVATITDSYTQQQSYVQIHQADEESSDTIQSPDAVFLSIAKREGENAVIVSDAILRALEQEMSKPVYENMSYEIYRNNGEVASDAISGLGTSLIQSVGIVFMVLLLFLGLRSASLVALAIPLSLALVFVVGLLSGQTINRITLFALILSLGLLVDSATVVVENIARHTSASGKSDSDQHQSIVTAVNEVGIGLILSTVTSVIVFLPTSQITGMMGSYMGPLSFFVPMALTMSLVVALVLIPLLAQITGSISLPAKIHLPNSLSALTRPILSLKQRLIPSQLPKQDPFDWLSHRYRAILQWLLAQKKRQQIFLTGTFITLLLVLTFPVLQLVHFRMLPSADKQQYYLYIDAPEGTDLAKTQTITSDIMQIVLDHPETVSVQSFVGEPAVVDFNGLFKASYLRQASYLATVRVNLTDPDTRTDGSSDIVTQMRQTLNSDQMIAQYQEDGTVIRFVEDPPGPPVQATLVAKVKGVDPEIREAVAGDLATQFATTEGVVDIDTSIEQPAFRTIYRVDQEKALESGVSSASIAQTLQAALDGTAVTQYHNHQHPEFSAIELQLREHDRDTIQDLSSIFVKSQDGTMVPVTAVVERVESRTIPARYLDDQQSTTYVSAEMSERSVVYAVIDLLISLIGNGYQLPDGGRLHSWNLFGMTFRDTDGFEYRIEWGGEWEMTLENFRDLGLAMMVAFVLIYGVLVAQFRSFTAPGLIMSTIPLGFLGILPGFAILDAVNDTFLTATSLIGFIALMGIVVNNAILYLEYYAQLLNEGKTVHQSLLTAGQTRLRPILLTSATTVLGSLTIAGDPVWSGLAWSIVFGLSLSSLFTLGVFPVLLNMVRPPLKGG